MEASEPKTMEQATSPNRNTSLELSSVEEELLREIIAGLRSIRFGSIAITLHEGRVVEIARTQRIRSGGARNQE